MSQNKRVPKELQKYVVITKHGGCMEAHYFQNQKEAKAWACGKQGKRQLFKITYDFYEEIKK
jgi:hypothetical protein